MSMTTNVVGFRPADEQWGQMKAVWNCCKEAGVAPPKEVLDFFDFEDPNGLPGMEVALGKSLTEYRSDGRDGFEVDLTKLPPGVTIIRMYNTY